MRPKPLVIALLLGVAAPATAQLSVDVGAELEEGALQPAGARGEDEAVEAAGQEADQRLRPHLRRSPERPGPP